MITILSGFIVFGRPFVRLWAGVDYEDAYMMTVCFFVSLYIPLIQNLGITILQARNQMKFRSLLYIVIAAGAFFLQFLFAKLWGGLGCAIAVSGALLLGQGLIMNIYYQRKQKLDILGFGKEILKMNILPVILSIIAMVVLANYNLNSWRNLTISVIAFMMVYAPLFYIVSMNKYERDLIVQPVKKILGR